MGGSLACRADCLGFDVSSCAACVSKPGARCDTVEGMDLVIAVGWGPLGAALVWLRTGERALHMTLVDDAGVKTLPDPIMTWREYDPQPDQVVVVGDALGWRVARLQLRMVATRHFDARGLATEEWTAVSTAEPFFTTDAAGNWYVLTGDWNFTPKVVPLSAAAVGKPQPISVPLTIQDAVNGTMLIPGPSNGVDLLRVSVGTSKNVTNYIRGKRVDVELSAGSTFTQELSTGKLTMNAESDTWAPREGKPWTVSRKLPEVPQGLFASNNAVVNQQLSVGGPGRVASAVLRRIDKPSLGLVIWLSGPPGH
jgi:hypothetical protein